MRVEPIPQKFFDGEWVRDGGAADGYHFKHFFWKLVDGHIARRTRFRCSCRTKGKQVNNSRLRVVCQL